MPVLVCHLSDLHATGASDPTLYVLPKVADVLIGLTDKSVEGVVLAFGGDAVDRGRADAFPAAAVALADLRDRVASATGVETLLLVVPGNHDLDTSGDQEMRDLALDSLAAGSAAARPGAGKEHEILAPLRAYFDFAAGLMPTGSHAKARPYYSLVTHQFGRHRVRLHLFNTACGCRPGAGANSLPFPVGELGPPDLDDGDYGVALLHHPFGWFRQPEVMRPLRDAVEARADLILTGHEHVGRAEAVRVRGGGVHEYVEAESLQDGGTGDRPGFHVLRLDFDAGRQVSHTFRWDGVGAFVGIGEPEDSPLGRANRRSARGHALRAEFEARLDDPELPVPHRVKGTLSLSDFFVYPDVMRFDDTAEGSGRQRVRGGDIADLIGRERRVLLFGPDRCGRTSLAKRLTADLHAAGDAPVLLSGGDLRNATPEKLGRVLERAVGGQYERPSPESYWQLPRERRVLIVDDLQDGPGDRRRRERLLKELDARFDRIVLLGPYDFCVADLIVGDGADPLWDYKQYRILPFGHHNCELFVRRWVELSGVGPDDAEGRAAEVLSLVRNLLRLNPIPHHPWVVLVLVQQADSPEPPAAQNGSYGHLLKSLITAALGRSRLKLPLNGKYRLLGELAARMYRDGRAVLADAEARDWHAGHKREFGPQWLDYAVARDDLADAGILRVEGGEVSFRQPYIYCFFVAWHLAQRLNEGDVASPGEVKELGANLHHEDTANVLVFLAHLTTSRAVLDAMREQADGLFSDVPETDLDGDVASLNDLYRTVQRFVLAGGTPEARRRAIDDSRDDALARRDERDGREASVRRDRPVPDQGEAHRRLNEFSSLARTVEILGQILRNEATDRRRADKVAVASAIFRLGRRGLGWVFRMAEDGLPRLIQGLEAHYRDRMPTAESENLVDEVRRHLFNQYLLLAFLVVRHVADAVGDRDLEDVFRELLRADGELPDRVYRLAIDLETGGGHLPLKEAEQLHGELSGTLRGPSGGPAKFNNFSQTLVRIFIVDHLHLRDVPKSDRDTICQKLKIEQMPAMLDPDRKRLPHG